MEATGRFPMLIQIKERCSWPRSSLIEAERRMISVWHAHDVIDGRQYSTE